MKQFPKIKPIGERSILIEFEPEIKENVLQKVMAVKELLLKKLVEEVVEINHTFNSLLITYTLPIEDAYSEFLMLKKEISGANIHYNFHCRLFHIPVCYEGLFALDLDEISAAKKMSEEKIVELHSGVEYRVFFTGFLPGFLYLGGLPEKLHFSRRKQPRLEVPKGAVGIGEKQTGIYPQTSPGGWNIIGNSPVPLFDPFKNPPCEISAGDKIKFYSISHEEHRQITEEVEQGIFELRKEEING